jgi:hypothetical protein
MIRYHYYLEKSRQIGPENETPRLRAVLFSSATSPTTSLVNDAVNFPSNHGNG